MATRVLIVLDGFYRFSVASPFDRDFTYTVLVDALTAAEMQVTKAHRESDASPGVRFPNFRFDGAGVNLFEFDVIWLIGWRGRNQTRMGDPLILPEPEIAALTRYMDEGGGVFATGDHDSVGADMCGRIPRVRMMRTWYGAGDSDSRMPAGFPPNFPPITSQRADTTRRNTMLDSYDLDGRNEEGFVWFENQSDSIPQTIRPTTTPAHPILRRNGRDILVFPDHMHEGQTLGVEAGFDYSEFPSLAGDHPTPEVIATGDVLGFQNRLATTTDFTLRDLSVATPKTINILSIYDGRRAGVGRIVTGSTFHHYVDINLTGDSDINTPELRARIPDAQKDHGFAHPGAEETFADIKAVFVNITNWLARSPLTIRLILERNTFGQDEVTVNPRFEGAILVTVDGLKPDQFPGEGGITTLSPRATPEQLARWAPAVSLPDVGDVVIIPTAVSSDDPALPARLQRFTFTYRLEFTADVFGVPEEVRTFPVNATLTTAAAPAALTDSARIQFVRSANPFMVDLAGDNTTTWLSSDLKVLRVVAGETFRVEAAGGTLEIRLPDGAMRADALSFIRTLTRRITPAQFEALPGNQDVSALSPFPTTMRTRRNIYNFAVARVRRNGTVTAGDMRPAATDVRVFFRMFTSQTTAALTYSTDAMGAPIEGYKKSPVAPIAVPGITGDGNEWLSFPFFAAAREADRDRQPDPDNVKNITFAESDKFFGALLDNNLADDYLRPTPTSTDAARPLLTLLTGEHQCLVAQIEFAGTPIPSGANPATSDKLAQRNIALSALANPGVDASRTAFHTFEIEATPQPITNELLPDELLLEWSKDVPEDTYVSIYIPSWNAQEVVELADRFYPRHEIRAVDAHTVELPGGGIRYVPIPKSLYRQTGVIAAELPLGIQKKQRFDVSVRQITNRSRNVKFPQPKVQPISLKEADELVRELGLDPTKEKRGVFDLGNNRSLVTDLSLIDAESDRALIIEHPDPEEVAAAVQDSRSWRETVGAFQLRILVSAKEDILLHHMRLLSVMTWRVAKLSRNSRWYRVLTRYIELLSDKVRALGGEPFAVPSTPDGMIPQLPGKDGGDEADNGGIDDPRLYIKTKNKISRLFHHH
jgi:hypothetical protein